MQIKFGSYISSNSLLHRMDPRLKLFMIVNLIVAIFLNTGFMGYFIILFALLVLFILSKLSVKKFLKVFKPIIFIFLFLLIINFFIIKPDSPQTQNQIGLIYNFNNVFVISWTAILQAAYLSFRVFLMISLTTILTSSTKPLDLSLAIEDLLSPLKLVKFPVHILSTIIAIAFRMIPTLLEEASKIMKAQASRGVDYKNGGFKDKIKAIGSLVIPLLVSSFQKAEDLAYAMDSRGYDPYQKRTRYRKFKISFLDIAILVFGMSFAIAIFTLYHLYGNLIPHLFFDKYILS